MTLTASNSDGQTIRVGQLWAWIATVVLLPVSAAAITMYVQGAVFGEKINTLQRDTIARDTQVDKLDDRLRGIDVQLGRILAKLEGIK